MKKIIKILIAVIVIFGIPLFLSFKFFPLSKEVCIPDFDISDDQLRMEGNLIDVRFEETLTKIFQIPQELKRYNIDFIVKPPPGCEANDVMFKESSFKKNFKFSPEKIDSNTWRIGSATITPDDSLSVPFKIIGWDCGPDHGDLNFENIKDFNLDNMYEVCVTQNIPAWILRLLFISIFFAIIFSSVITIVNWINKKSDKN